MHEGPLQLEQLRPAAVTVPAPQVWPSADAYVQSVQVVRVHSRSPLASPKPHTPDAQSLPAVQPGVPSAGLQLPLPSHADEPLQAAVCDSAARAPVAPLPQAPVESAKLHASHWLSAQIVPLAEHAASPQPQKPEPQSVLVAHGVPSAPRQTPRARLQVVCDGQSDVEALQPQLPLIRSGRVGSTALHAAEESGVAPHEPSCSQ